MRPRGHLAGDPADARAGGLHPRVDTAPSRARRAPRAAALAAGTAMRPERSGHARIHGRRARAGARPARALPGRAAGTRGRRCAGRGDAVSPRRAALRRSATCSAAGPSTCRAAPGATIPPWRCAWPRASPSATTLMPPTSWRATRAGSARAICSATGQCLGITAATARALAAAPWRGRPPLARERSGALDPEPLSRVAPIVLHFFAAPERGGGAGGGCGALHQPLAAGARCLPVAGGDAACGAARRAARARAASARCACSALSRCTPTWRRSRRAATVADCEAAARRRRRARGARAGALVPGEHARIFATAHCAPSISAATAM